MEAKPVPSAVPWLPRRLTLPALAQVGCVTRVSDLRFVRAGRVSASKNCEGCDLFRFAAQTVFGEGTSTAAVVMIGEQPGDQEDRSGKPFVGPAGKLRRRR